MKHSLEHYGRVWAQSAAIARERKFTIDPDSVSRAYAAFVEGDSKTLEREGSKLCKALNLTPRERVKAFRSLPKTARREASRLAFKS